MELRAKASPGFAEGGRPHASDQFVISLGKRPKVRSDAVSHILELLEWRYSLAETVLFHRSKLAAAAMLDRALYELWGAEDGGTGEDELIAYFLPLGDEELLAQCRDLANTRAKSAKGIDRKRYENASTLLAALQGRRLYKHLSTFLYTDLGVDEVNAIKEKFSPSSPTELPTGEGSAKSSANARNSLLLQLEKDFHLEYGSLAMYCPSKMNRKIAEVKIAVGEVVEKLHAYEDHHDNELTGGHLVAQLHRFDRLWRVHFFLDPKERARIGEEWTNLLRLGIEQLALGRLPDTSSEEASRLIATGLLALTHPQSPWAKKHLVAHGAAASGNPSVAQSYPFGAPSIESQISSEK